MNRKMAVIGVGNMAKAIIGGMLSSNDAGVDKFILFDKYKDACMQFFNNEKFEIIEFFKENDINVQKADIPFVKVMISDSKEMLHTYTKFSEDKRNVIPETAIGIWNKYEEIAKNYDDRFMNQLKKLKKKEKST